MSIKLFDLPDALIPSRMKEIAGYCSEQTAILLLLNYPGIHLKIPMHPTPTHKLADILGIKEFAKLCEMYGDEVIQIPRAAKAIRSLRNQSILKDFSKGLYQSTIALKHGLTERKINTICNTVQFDHQLDMFQL